MESSPREEVFLGAFQFQPENTIQMFHLQVPKQSPAMGIAQGPHVIPLRPGEVLSHY